MICNDKYETINLIQGDTLSVDFIIDDLVYTENARVFFVCNALDLRVELPPANLINEDSDDDEDWEDQTLRPLYIEDTTGFRIGEFEYDLTAYEEDTDRVTYIYHGTIAVKPRFQRRKTSYNPYYEYPKNTRHTPAREQQVVAADTNIVANLGYNPTEGPEPEVHGFGYTED